MIYILIMFLLLIVTTLVLCVMTVLLLEPSSDGASQSDQGSIDNYTPTPQSLYVYGTPTPFVEITETPTPDVDYTMGTPTPDGMVETPTPDGVMETPTPDGVMETPTPDGVMETPTPDGVMETPTPDDVMQTSTLDSVMETPTPTPYCDIQWTECPVECKLKYSDPDSEQTGIVVSQIGPQQCPTSRICNNHICPREPIDCKDIRNNFSSINDLKNTKIDTCNNQRCPPYHQLAYQKRNEDFKCDLLNEKDCYEKFRWTDSGRVDACVWIKDACRSNNKPMWCPFHDTHTFHNACYNMTRNMKKALKLKDKYGACWESHPDDTSHCEELYSMLQAYNGESMFIYCKHGKGFTNHTCIRNTNLFYDRWALRSGIRCFEAADFQESNGECVTKDQNNTKYVFKLEDQVVKVAKYDKTRYMPTSHDLAGQPYSRTKAVCSLYCSQNCKKDCVYYEGMEGNGGETSDCLGFDLDWGPGTNFQSPRCRLIYGDENDTVSGDGTPSKKCIRNNTHTFSP